MRFDKKALYIAVLIVIFYYLYVIGLKNGFNITDKYL